MDNQKTAIKKSQIRKKNRKNRNLRQKAKKRKTYNRDDYCKVTPVFQGEDVFIIGGGPSLKSFDFSVLTNKNVVGCNDAYLLNEIWKDTIVNILYFGDHAWWCKFHGKDKVEKDGTVYTGAKHFNGPVYGSCNRYINDPKVQMLARRNNGLQETPLIGWYMNTGASSINLAFQLGASRVIILGFDMQKTGNNSHNYFKNLKNPTVNDSVIMRHKKGVEKLSKDQQNSQWKDVPVWNAGPDSALECFPKVKINDVL